MAIRLVSRPDTSEMGRPPQVLPVDNLLPRDYLRAPSYVLRIHVDKESGRRTTCPVDTAAS